MSSAGCWTNSSHSRTVQKSFFIFITLDKLDMSLRSQKCVNCHSTQPNHPENKLFYYRGPNGGLILTYNGKVQRINTKAGDMYAGTVYPAWHPSLPFIAFSSNVIKQQFMSYDPQKIEQFDLYSDLVLYDIKKNEITAICKTKDKQESTPCWSADGQYLYFASSDSMMEKRATSNICFITFTE